MPRVALPTVSVPRFTHAQLLAGAVVALAAAGGAAILPFYPPGLVAAIGLLAGLLVLFAPRAGLAVALAAPVFPLGNLAAGAAVAYGVAAVLVLALGWRDARTGLAFLAGPLLAPLGAVALVPLAVQPVRGTTRRAVQAALALPAAALVAGLRGAPLPLGEGSPGDLGLAETESPGAVIQALAQTLAATPSIVVVSLGLAAAAALLPYARSRGPRGLAALGAGLLAVTLLGAPGAPALPLVAAAWALCAGLGLKDGR